jgi:hypothetical protein
VPCQILLDCSTAACVPISSNHTYRRWPDNSLGAGGGWIVLIVSRHSSVRRLAPLGQLGSTNTKDFYYVRKRNCSRVHSAVPAAGGAAVLGNWKSLGPSNVGDAGGHQQWQEYSPRLPIMSSLAAAHLIPNCRGRKCSFGSIARARRRRLLISSAVFVVIVGRIDLGRGLCDLQVRNGSFVLFFIRRERDAPMRRFL